MMIQQSSSIGSETRQLSLGRAGAEALEPRKEGGRALAVDWTHEARWKGQEQRRIRPMMVRPSHGSEQYAAAVAMYECLEIQTTERPQYASGIEERK